MKTTKSRMVNIIIVCSIAVNLAAVSGLCYIASVDSKSDRMDASLDLPVIIYAPKSVKLETTAMLETSPAK